MNWCLVCREILVSLIGSACLSLAMSVVAADEQVLHADSVRQQLTDLAARAAAAEAAQQSVVSGTDGWLYFVPELRAISAGPFRGEHAAGVSRAARQELADPLEAILDFHKQLSDAGIRLLLLPVPAKLAVYPEPLLGAATPLHDGQPLRLDVHHAAFYDILRQRGVEVVDVLPEFLKNRGDKNDPLFCQTDTHWSARGAKLAADLLLQRLAGIDWPTDITRTPYVLEQRRLEIAGDLASMLQGSSPTPESLTLTVVGERQGDQFRVPRPWRASPLLLIGDSHTLVFHDPQLFASGSGLPDHLARGLGFPPDLIGVRGSGATTTRIELLRRRDNLRGKSVVVWCLSFREFTESTTGWRKVPVIGR